MGRDALSRYDRDDQGRVVIDVSARRVEELYHDFDRSAPYIRRDLDPDLVDYLIDCAREIRSEPFLICFSLEAPPDDSRQARIRRSVKAYFHYLAEGEWRKVVQMLRRSAVLFGIGLAILFLSVSVNKLLGSERSVVANVFAEGLTVAAWVSLWESLAVFLIEWFPQHRDRLLYRRLADTAVVFRPEDQA